MVFGFSWSVASPAAVVQGVGGSPWEPGLHRMWCRLEPVQTALRSR